MKQKTRFKKFGSIGYWSMNGRYISIGPKNIGRSLIIIPPVSDVHMMLKRIECKKSIKKNIAKERLSIIPFDKVKK